MRSVWAIVTGVLILWAQGTCYGWHISGCVYCERNGNGVIDDEDTPLAGVVVLVAGAKDTFEATTGKSGCFFVPLPDEPDTYTVTLDESTLPADPTILLPEDGEYEFTLDYGSAWVEDADWLVDSPECRPQEDGACWLTGGGVKFDSTARMWCATHGPRHNFGGNVFPSCDPDPGDGGQWNHVAHSEKLHFLGTTIREVECGNAPGIEPGSESPVTPFNYIEFRGSGRLNGIRGNKDDYDMVYFFARCEDRNEPGSRGAKAGADIDRYFLHVFGDPDDPAGSTLLLVDMDGDPTTLDPITITGGNLQLHASSCDDGAKSLAAFRKDRPEQGAVFLRGDSNLDGVVDLADSIATLGSLYAGGPSLPCGDAADTNDDGQVDVSDVVMGLSHLFVGGTPIAEPYPEPWLDPTRDRLLCRP